MFIHPFSLFVYITLEIILLYTVQYSTTEFMDFRLAVVRLQHGYFLSHVQFVAYFLILQKKIRDLRKVFNILVSIPFLSLNPFFFIEPFTDGNILKIFYFLQWTHGCSSSIFRRMMDRFF